MANNLRISQSNVTVLNLRSIKTIETAVGVIRKSGDAAAADALRDITEAIAKDEVLDVARKHSAIDAVSVLAHEGASPSATRRPSIVRSTILVLAGHIQTAPAVTAAWNSCVPIIKNYFGLYDER